MIEKLPVHIIFLFSYVLYWNISLWVIYSSIRHGLLNTAKSHSELPEEEDFPEIWTWC